MYVYFPTVVPCNCIYMKNVRRRGDWDYAEYTAPQSRS
jgi:hypothetical protein